MPNFASGDEVVMEDPYLQAVWLLGSYFGPRTLAQSWRLGNAKVCQNDEILETKAAISGLCDTFRHGSRLAAVRREKMPVCRRHETLLWVSPIHARKT
ncbi:MAG: hypothetical protein WA820_00275 [Bradyrhizobium sp.]|jgi:hypothetical protein